MHNLRGEANNKSIGDDAAPSTNVNQSLLLALYYLLFEVPLYYLLFTTTKALVMMLRQAQMLINRQKRPTRMTKEACSYDKRGLLV